VVASTSVEACRDTGQVPAPVDLLATAAEPVRWEVLRLLAAGRACVCELQDHVAVAPNLLSYHLKVLRDAGLVTATRRGRWVDYDLAPDAWQRLAGALPISEGGER
jgi:ArsR family transcriptional regulator